MQNHVAEEQPGQLSDGQRDCLRLVLAHLTSKEIARRLDISSHTVDQRIRYAMRTLRARSRTEAAMMFAAIEGSQLGQQPVYNTDTLAVSPQTPSSGINTRQTCSPLMYQSPDLPEDVIVEPSVPRRTPNGPYVDYRENSHPASIGNFSQREQEAHLQRIVARDGAASGSDHTLKETFFIPVWDKPNPYNWHQRLILVVLIAALARLIHEASSPASARLM